ncbi:hypothetical protein GJ654_18830 [Rhodoblastus acidophilus]|uniref:Mu-like prophage protein gp46 n=1 Tax=Rhodoblastus acidophilus TaxID=1074 RepID=A0A6N8DRF4_RHOAC|nr:phage GP46 family protein [Rhodoblastus acidophilus]MCW2276384.1 phage gp46-like protein [Rhodoblastus acidophilus]MTV33039.1 hypothetical protein [Rhodoblastus acidophilus]
MAITTRVLTTKNAVPPPDIVWNGVRGDFALAADGGLRGGETFASAVCMLLFSDAACEKSDLTMFDNGDRRGWIGDAFDIDAGAGEGPMGSLLWRFRRSELVAETGYKVEDAARSALRPLITQKACARIDVSAEVDAPAGLIRLFVTIYGEDGGVMWAARFDILWQAIAGKAGGPLLKP